MKTRELQAGGAGERGGQLTGGGGQEEDEEDNAIGITRPLLRAMWACQESGEAGARGSGQDQLPAGNQAATASGRQRWWGWCEQPRSRGWRHSASRDSQGRLCAAREEGAGAPCGGGSGGRRRISAALRSREVLGPGQGLTISSAQQERLARSSRIRRKGGR